MHIQDFLVEVISPEVLSFDVNLLHYKSLSAINSSARSLVERYPKEVSTLRYRMGLHSAMDYEILLGDDGLRCLWEYYLAHGCRGVAEVLGVCFNSAQRLSRRFGFQDPKHSAIRKQYRRDLKAGPNPLLSESALKWYLYGFILGDGSLVVKRSSAFDCSHARTFYGYDEGSFSYLKSVTLSLVLSSKDLEFLSGFASFFPQGSLRGPYKGCYCFKVNDRGVCDSLLRMGILPRKSYNPTELSIIPDCYFPYVLLGLLDSDGCVSWENKGRTLRLMWCGHSSYLFCLYSRLQTICPSVRFRVRADGLGIMSLYRTSEQVVLCNLMYNAAPYFLERKYVRIKSTLTTHGFLY